MKRLTIAACALSLVTAACGTTVPYARGGGPYAGGSGQGLGPLGSGSGAIAGSTRSGIQGFNPATGAAGGGPGVGQQASGAGSSSAGAGSAGGGGVAPGASTSSPIATSGPGWDAHNVYIGVPTENDASQVISTIGISFNPGNEDDDANSIVNYINAHGGVLGRKIVPVFHDNSTPSIESDPDTVAQQNCAYFAQDHRVAEVVNFLPAIFIAGCLQTQHVPDVEASSVIFDSQYYSRYGPDLWTTVFPNVDILAPSLVNQLSAEHYFSPWNTATGSAGGGPVKVGILEPDSPVGRDLAGRLVAQLRSFNYDVVSPFFYTDSAQSYGSQMSSAVLQFAAAGVTHVISIPPVAAALLFFSQSAESQHYRPRYAMTSYTLPSQAAGDLPAGQINGALGIGWFPGDDVAMAQAPPPDPAAVTCNAALKQAGVDYTTELELGNAWAFCDAVTLFVDAAEAGGGFGAGSISSGMAVAGAHFAPAATFGSGLSDQDHALPGEVRDLAYTKACSCFEYIGPPQPMN